MHDVVIIGSGAGGGPLAFELARAGLDVLVLEKGPRFRREQYTREAHGLAPGAFTPDLASDPHTVVTRKTRTPLRTTLGWIACCVGGGTTHMGGYFYRFHRDDFRMRQRFGAKPLDTVELVDWPYSYEDLEPYYTRAEWEIGVAGQAGADPSEGHRSRPYPLPPVDAHPLAVPLEKVCRRKGLSPFPTPRSINSRPYQGRPACAYCETCAGLGCPVGARGSTQEALLPRAEATGRCKVRSQSTVCEVLVDRSGRVSGCVYRDSDGKEHEVAARIVCLCASAIESARLLLLSRSPRFPDGLANSTGLVGRHLQFHGVTQGEARLPLDQPPGDLLQRRHVFLGRSVSDFYFLPAGVSPLAKGGMLRFGMASQQAPGSPAGVGHESRRGLIGCEIFHDFLPNTGTWMELDDEVCDRWGSPVARIHLDRPQHHVTAGRWVLGRAFEVFQDLGAVALRATDVGGTSSYLVQGTCRAGRDPRTSVLNEYCQAHEVSNLFVVDGSFMPTSGGTPPTLTILANSFRTAQHIVERWKSADF
ncbi:MAG: GMC family oxidoreductase [Acidobacteriota bacterium]